MRTLSVPPPPPEPSALQVVDLSACSPASAAPPTHARAASGAIGVTPSGPAAGATSLQQRFGAAAAAAAADVGPPPASVAAGQAPGSGRGWQPGAPPPQQEAYTHRVLTTYEDPNVQGHTVYQGEHVVYVSMKREQRRTDQQQLTAPMWVCVHAGAGADGGFLIWLPERMVTPLTPNWQAPKRQRLPQPPVQLAHSQPEFESPRAAAPAAAGGRVKVEPFGCGNSTRSSIKEVIEIMSQGQGMSLSDNEPHGTSGGTCASSDAVADGCGTRAFVAEQLQ